MVVDEDGERLYTYRYTVTTRMTTNGSLLVVWDKVTRQRHAQTTTLLKRKENRSGIEPRSFCLSAQRLTARPNRLTTRRRPAGTLKEEEKKKKRNGRLKCLTTNSSTRTNKLFR